MGKQREDAEREPQDVHYVHCSDCGQGKVFEGGRISEAAEAWSGVHALTHQREGDRGR